MGKITFGGDRKCGNFFGLTEFGATDSFWRVEDAVLNIAYSYCRILAVAERNHLGNKKYSLKYVSLQYCWSYA